MKMNKTYIEVIVRDFAGRKHLRFEISFRTKLIVIRTQVQGASIAPQIKVFCNVK